MGAQTSMLRCCQRHVWEIQTRLHGNS